MTNTNERPKIGGVLHTDLCRAQARIANALLLVDGDPEAVRMLSSAFDDLDKLIARLFAGQRATVVRKF